MRMSNLRLDQTARKGWAGWSALWRWSKEEMKKDNFLKIVRCVGDINFFLLGILYALNYAAVIVGRVAGLTTGTEIIYCVIPLFEIGIRYSFPAIFLISSINYFRAFTERTET